MGTKIILFGASLFLLTTFSACGKSEGTDYVSSDKYEKIKDEYEEVIKNKEATIKKTQEQAEAIATAIGKLNEITNKTQHLRTDSEVSGRKKQTEELLDLISVAESMMKNTKNEYKGDTDFENNIDNLSSILGEYKKEINELKAQVENKTQTINERNFEIAQKDMQLRNAESMSWYSMGIELYRLGKGKKKVDVTGKYLLEKAAFCFKRSNNLGHQDAGFKYIEVSNAMR